MNTTEVFELAKECLAELIEERGINPRKSCLLDGLVFYNDVRIHCGPRFRSNVTKDSMRKLINDMISAIYKPEHGYRDLKVYNTDTQKFMRPFLLYINYNLDYKTTFLILGCQSVLET